jgi:Trk K+ transport system NAD-binding subunit
MSLTTYFITFENRLSELFSWPLNFLDKVKTNKENLENIDRNDKEVVIFGCHRIGGLILRDLNNHKRNLMVVDYNPQIIKSLINKDIPCIYGDFMHEEILEKINLKNSKIFISTIPAFEENKELIKKIKRVNKGSIVIVVARNIDEANELYKRGVDYVILPKFISGEKISELIKDSKKGKMGRLRTDHKKYLKGIGRFID